jgi:hypothetical protein
MGRKRNKLDRFHYHEALDRAYIVANMTDDVLFQHPVIQKHKNLKKKVEKAENLLYEVYQLIGGLDLKLFPDDSEMRGKQ